MRDQMTSNREAELTAIPRIGSGAWLGGERAICYKCGKEAKIIRPEHLPGMWRFKGHRNQQGKTCSGAGEYHSKQPKQK